MKAYLIVCGLLATACLAQDWFYEKKGQYYIGSGSDSGFISNGKAFSSSVVLNNHVYAFMELKKSELSSTLSEVSGNQNQAEIKSNTVISAVVDLTANKSVFVGVSNSDTSTYNYVPETLCTDGKYLYASMYKLAPSSNPVYNLVDKFPQISTSINAYSAIYKIDKDLKVLDRVASQTENKIALLSCTATHDGSSVFLLKLDKGYTQATLYDKNMENSLEFGEYGNNGCVFGVKNLFSQSPAKIFSYENAGESKIPGSVVGTGVSDTFFVSFFTGSKYIVSVGSSSFTSLTTPVTYNVEGDYDYPNIVPMSSDHFISVFTSSKAQNLCSKAQNGITYLVLLPHTVANNVVTAGSAKCIALGTSGENPDVQSRRTIAVAHPSDGKFFVMAPYKSYKFNFCQTVLYSAVSGDKEAASVLASFDADSLQCLAAQTIDPTFDHRTRGMVAVDDETIAFTEFHNPPTPSTTWTAWTRIFTYERCEDGVIDKDTNDCVCFTDGITCHAHDPVVPSSSSSSSSSSATTSSSTTTSSASSQSTGSHSSGATSQSSSTTSQSQSASSKTKSSSAYSSGHVIEPSGDDDESDMDYTPYVIATIAATGAFLILSIVFIVLFFACK